MGREGKRRRHKQRRVSPDDSDSDDSVIIYDTDSEDCSARDVESTGGLTRSRCPQCRRCVHRVARRPLFFARMTAEVSLSLLVLVYLVWRWYGSHSGEFTSMHINMSSVVAFVSRMRFQGEKNR